MDSELVLGLINNCKLSKQTLYSEANKSDWGNLGKRGGFDYKPPYGWIGIGLDVLNKYDEGNNDWLSKDGNKNEWAVAYANASQRTINHILTSGFRIGNGQAYANYDDIYHPGHKVGRGVYCSPNVEIMETYAKFDREMEINGKKYILGLMLRVNPKKIRCPSENKQFWVLNPGDDEIRPYRILIKEIIE